MGRRVSKLEGLEINHFTVLKASKDRSSSGGVFWNCQCI